MEQDQRDERDYDYYGPYYDHLTGNAPLKEGIIQEESKLSPVT
jgi:hypothetical protein